jgi:hypothetical protein
MGKRLGVIGAVASLLADATGAPAFSAACSCSSQTDLLPMMSRPGNCPSHDHVTKRRVASALSADTNISAPKAPGMVPNPCFRNRAGSIERSYEKERSTLLTCAKSMYRCAPGARINGLGRPYARCKSITSSSKIRLPTPGAINVSFVIHADTPRAVDLPAFFTLIRMYLKTGSVPPTTLVSTRQPGSASSNRTCICGLSHQPWVKFIMKVTNAAVSPPPNNPTQKSRRFVLGGDATPFSWLLPIMVNFAQCLCQWWLDLSPPPRGQCLPG